MGCAPRGEEEENEKPSKKGQVPDCDDFGEVSEEDDEAVIAKYRALLGDATKDSGSKDDSGNDDDEESKGMEITFIPEADKRAAAKEKAKEKMTPWEKYLEKKKEKRKAKWDKKKQEAAGEVSSDDDNEEDEDDEEEDDDIPSDVDMNDPFFKTEIQKMDKDGQSKKNKKKGKASANQKPKEEPAKSDLSLLVMDSDDDKSHFDYKKIVKHESKSKKAQKKAKRKEKEVQEDNFKLDLADSRFSAIFDNPKVRPFCYLFLHGMFLF